MDIFIIQLERGCFSLVQDFYGMTQDFNLAGGHIRINRTFWPITDLTGNTNDKFIAN